MITLIACDIDGTLVDDRKRIPPANRAAIAAARARGVRFVLCSGRPPRAIRRFWQDLGLSEPVVAYNGALLWDMAGGRALQEAVLPPGDLACALQLVRDLAPRTALSVEAGDRWWTDRLDPARFQRVDAGFAVPPVAEGPIEAVVGGLRVHKLLFPLPSEKRFIALLRALPAGLAATRNRQGLVEVQAAGADKATAVAHLATAAEVLAIGDDANDLPLLRWAGDSAAPASATPEARAAARRIVADHNAGAVADALDTQWCP